MSFRSPHVEIHRGTLRDGVSVHLVVTPIQMQQTTNVDFPIFTQADGEIVLDFYNFTGAVRIARHQTFRESSDLLNIPQDDPNGIIQRNSTTTQNLDGDIISDNTENILDDDDSQHGIEVSSHLASFDPQNNQSNNNNNNDDDNDDDDNDDDNDNPNREGAPTLTVITNNTIPTTTITNMTGPQFASRLHEICSKHDAKLEDLQQILDDDPSAASLPDQHGRLPLHYFGNNAELFESIGGCVLATAFATKLIEAFPLATLAADHLGRMPFTEAIETWVESSYFTSTSRHNRGNNRFLGNWQAPFNLTNLTGVSAATGFSTVRSATSAASNQTHQTGFNAPPDAMLRNFPLTATTEFVEWCFEILSTVLDGLGGDPDALNIRPNASFTQQITDREALASNVASIPFLFKTILLLESNSTRQKILETPIIQRSLLRSEGVGRWMTNMLRHRKYGASLVNDFLELLSKVSIEQYAGKFRNPTEDDIRSFRYERRILFESVEEIKGIIPSLATLDNRQLDRAVSTRLVWYIANRSLNKVFIVGLVLNDFIMHVALMLAYRNRFSDSGDQFPEYLALRSDLLIFILCCYVIYRKIAETLALINVSTNVFFQHILDIWTLGEVACIPVILAVIFIELFQEDESRPVLNAVVFGLLWFRFLSVLKIVNRHTATFILSLVETTTQVRYFMIVLAVTIMLFADMFRVIHRTDGELCAGELSETAADFCAKDITRSFLRVYAIILGDLSLSDYVDSTATAVIFVLVTIFGFLVLLNFLIAIVNDSYVDSKKRSNTIFRRARITFLASHVALEGRMQLGSKVNSNRGKIGLVGPYIGGFMIAVSSVVSLLYMVERATEFPFVNAFLARTGLVLLSVAVLVPFWITLSFMFGHVWIQKIPPHAAAVFTKMDTWINFLALASSNWLFGLDRDILDLEKDSKREAMDDDPLTQQLLALQKSLQQTELALRNDSEALKKEINDLAEKIEINKNE